MPCDYTSSKISTLFTKTEPTFVKEFLSVKNIKYIKVKNYPDYCNLWDDMMNKITFTYNFRYLESKKIFDEYKEFNIRYAKEINEMCEEDDLIIINDSSLYLLPGLVKCKVAIRNLEFDECFIERVPYYMEVLSELFKAQKFFISEKSQKSFINYVSCCHNFMDYDIGGCYYINSHVDKYAVLDVLKVFTAYVEQKRTNNNIKQNELIKHFETLTMPKESKVILTNVPLLHLEAYIKKYSKLNVRYIRASVEIDEKQERMVQYLKKAYGCQIDVIDKHDYNIIVAEMVYCDIFIGSKYNELGKLLLKPTIHDEIDPCSMKKKIEKVLEVSEEGKRRLLMKQKSVLGEEEYLNEFLALNKCRIENEDLDFCIDEKISQYIEGLFAWIQSNFEHISNLMPMQNNSMELENEANESIISINENEVIAGNQGEIEKDEVLYEKNINGERILYKKRSGSKSTSIVNNNFSKDEECRNKNFLEYKSKNICKKNTDSDEKNSSISSFFDQKNTSVKYTKKIHDPEPADFEKIKEFWDRSSKVALLDYDGTLSEIQKLPDMAKPNSELFEVLDKFNEKGKVIICTGRSVETVDKWFPTRYEVFAEHGCAHRKNGKWTFKPKIKGIDDCIEIMTYYQIRTPGSIVEIKSCGCAFHYKQVKDFDLEKLYFLLKKLVGTAVVLGKGVIEVKSSTKYDVAIAVAPDIVAGDDNVDEEMYEGCKNLSIRIGNRKTKADYYIESVSGMLSLLKELSK